MEPYPGDPANAVIRSVFAGRDFAASLLLFTATAGFVLWQNSQVAVLWDLSYLLDTGWRIALGQVPYRDFPLVHPPLTFLVQAGLMRLAGRQYLWQIAYVAVVGGLGTVVTWRIVLSLLRERFASAWWISLLLTAPLIVLGIYSVYPHPIYDGDCAFAILVAVWLLQRIRARNSTGPVAAFLTGLTVVLPVLFKQNIGLPFLVTIVGSLLVFLAVDGFQRMRGREQSQAREFAAPLLAGIGVATVAAAGLIQATAGLDNFLHWTVRFAAQRRLPGFAAALDVYREPALLWTLPCVGAGVLLLLLPLARRIWIRRLAFCLLAAPFAGRLIFLLRSSDSEERADSLLSLWPAVLLVAGIFSIGELRKGIALKRLLPFFVLAAVQGTLLSQSVAGSSYAIWPLLILLVAWLLTALPFAGRWFAPALAGVVCVTLLVCGGLYAVGHNRLNYVDMPGGTVRRATLAPLAGMVDRGPYIAEFEELLRFAEREIPAEDALLILPGEDPFYFASGREPRFPVLLFDPTTDPFSAEELMAAGRKRNVRWVIVKTHQQSTDDQMPEKERTLGLVRAEFTLYRRLTGYEIYRCGPA